jgi:GNAT superfamily N-acetyltransferase
VGTYQPAEGSGREETSVSDPATLERIELGSPRLKQFVDVPWRLMRGDPYWTPPLRADLLGSTVLKIDGLLRPTNPYHRHAEVCHWIAWRGDEPVGCISASVDRAFNEFHKTCLGNFGFFDCLDDAEVASQLVDTARAWIAERGMLAMRGPGQYGNATHERQGVLVEGFQYPPVVELTHNPSYYGRLLEDCGLVKVKDYVAYTLDLTAPGPTELPRIAQQVRRHHPEIRTRSADRSRLADEVALIVDLYNAAWKDNWGFMPLTPDDAAGIVASLEPIVDEEFVRFAYVGDVPAAVFGGIPDPYWALRPRWKWYGDSDAVRVARLLASRGHIPRTRMMFFGIRPEFRALGIDAILYEETLRAAHSRGYRECDISMLLEDNVLIRRAAEFMGARCYKTWRIYEMPVGSAPIGPAHFAGGTATEE